MQQHTTLRRGFSEGSLKDVLLGSHRVRVSVGTKVARRVLRSVLGLGSCGAGLAWKTAKSRKEKRKMENQMENSLGPRMEKKWKTPSKIQVFAIFFLCPPGGCFPFGVPFFPHFRLLAVFHAVPARHDPNSLKGWCHRLSGPVLRDTAGLSQRYPAIARYGVFGVSTWPIGCDTSSTSSERFPFVGQVLNVGA